MHQQKALSRKGYSSATSLLLNKQAQDEACAEAQWIMTLTETWKKSGLKTLLRLQKQSQLALPNT